MSVHLVGGGRDADAASSILVPFVREARQRAADPTIGVLLVLERDDDSSEDRFRGLVEAAGADAVRVVRVAEGERFEADVVAGLDAVFVGGGLTPAYHDAFAGIGDAVRARVADGMPFAGFSAGAAIAAGPALVGGYRLNGVEIGSEDAAEELDEVEVRRGLGLVPFAVDVHAAQWGTLSRLVAAVQSGLVPEGVAIDEHTLLTVAPDGSDRVAGAGHVWRVVRTPDGVQVTARSS